MNRRELLKGMLAAGLVLPSTKFIFDLGANKRHVDLLSKFNFIETWRGMFISLPTNPAYESAPYEELLITGYDPKGIVLTEKYPRRFDYELIEIPPFRV